MLRNCSEISLALGDTCTFVVRSSGFKVMRPVSVLRSAGPWVMELYMWEDVPLGQSTSLYTLSPVFNLRQENSASWVQ